MPCHWLPYTSLWPFYMSPNPLMVAILADWTCPLMASDSDSPGYPCCLLLEFLQPVCFEMWARGTILLPDCMGLVETLYIGYRTHFLYLKVVVFWKKLALWPGINVVIALACFISTLYLIWWLQKEICIVDIVLSWNCWMIQHSTMNIDAIFWWCINTSQCVSCTHRRHKNRYSFMNFS